MSVNSEGGEILNCVYDRRVKAMHYFPKAELNLLFYVFMRGIHKYTDHLPLASSYHSKQLASQSTH